MAYYLGGEIISADSRQVYRGLDIGSGKDLTEYTIEEKKIPYHLIDIYEPGEQFFLHHFMKGLREAFDDIRSRGNLPIIAGGTGLYLDALRKDFSFTLAPEDPELRNELAELDKTKLLMELQRLSPALAEGIDTSSKKRLIRGIEIARHFAQTGLPEAREELPYNPYYIGIETDAKARRSLIAERLDKRLAAGLIDEAQRLLDSGVSHERLQRLGLEYKFLSYYLLGKMSLDEMRKKLVTAIAQFAKRQMTWFRKMEKEGVSIEWVPVDADAKMLAEKLRELIKEPQ